MTLRNYLPIFFVTTSLIAISASDHPQSVKVDVSPTNQPTDSLFNALVNYVEQNQKKSNTQREIIWTELIDRAYGLRMQLKPRALQRKDFPDIDRWQFKLGKLRFNASSDWWLTEELQDSFKRNPDSLFASADYSLHLYSVACEDIGYGQDSFLKELRKRIKEGMFEGYEAFSAIMLLQNLLESGCSVNYQREIIHMRDSMLLPLATNLKVSRLLDDRPKETLPILMTAALLCRAEHYNLVPAEFPSFMCKLMTNSGGIKGNTMELGDSYFESVIGLWVLSEFVENKDAFGPINQYYVKSLLKTDYTNPKDVSDPVQRYVDSVGITLQDYYDSISNIPRGATYDPSTYHSLW